MGKETRCSVNHNDAGYFRLEHDESVLFPHHWQLEAKLKGSGAVQVLQERDTAKIEACTEYLHYLMRGLEALPPYSARNGAQIVLWRGVSRWTSESRHWKIRFRTPSSCLECWSGSGQQHCSFRTISAYFGHIKSVPSLARANPSRLILSRQI